MFAIKFLAAAVLLLWCVPAEQVDQPERPGARHQQIVDANPNQTRRTSVTVGAAAQTPPCSAERALDESRDNTDRALDMRRDSADPARDSTLARVPDAHGVPLAGDATPLPLTLTLDDLQALADAGHVTLAHPEGGELHVALAELTLHASGRVFSVQTDGYAGVITQRGERFFATLATARGVYTIEHTPASGSVAFSQRQLDLRINRQDYQRAPAA